MTEWKVLFFVITNIAFVMTLGWYLITNLQWYDYKIERVITKHHKSWWHIVYFIVPFIAYYALGEFFWIFFYFAVLPSVFIWHKRLDKKLVLTWRVKRYLLLLLTLTLFQDFLCVLKQGCEVFGVLLPLVASYFGSYGIEKYLFFMYKKQAERKLLKLKNLKIVAVTGSYGKTSTKNFIAQLLEPHFKVYATPRSVNTLGGIVKDVNQNLDDSIEVYVCEAGARVSGDILEITKLLNPHVAVVGKIGPQHLEYFKTIENIKRTKLELIHSNRLEIAFIHESVTNEPHEKVVFFGSTVNSVHATLNGTDFNFNYEDENLPLHVSVLGAFQVINIEAAILVAKYLGLSKEQVKEGVNALKSVAHRLERIDAGGKIILDDSYNGNIDGMLEAVRLCSEHKGGKRVIVTPGLVESTEELNTVLINNINRVFDVAIITGQLNKALFKRELRVNEKVFLENKAGLESVLKHKSGAGDIILFANDAPNFI